MELGQKTSVSRWRIRAIVVLQPVMTAQRRFSESMRVNKVTMLAAADELDAATKDGAAWLATNPCPNAKLEAHVSWLLNACTEVALAAQRSVTGPFAGTQVDPDRLRDLVTAIDFHSETFDAW